MDSTMIQNTLSHTYSFTPAEFSAWVTAIVTALTLIFGFYVKYIKKENYRNSDKLINHNVFRSLIKYRKFIQYNFQVVDTVKCEVYRDLLIKKLDIWYKLLTDLATYIDSKCTDCNVDCKAGITIAELKRIHIDTLMTGIDLYNNYYNSQDYTEKEKILCKYAVDKFNIMHSDKVAMVESGIEMLDDSFRFTQCPKALTDMIFNIYTVAFVMAFKDMNEVINSSNGYFEGKTFRRRSYKISEVSFIQD